MWADAAAVKRSLPLPLSLRIRCLIFCVLCFSFNVTTQDRAVQLVTFLARLRNLFLALTVRVSQYQYG